MTDTNVPETSATAGVEKVAKKLKAPLKTSGQKRPTTVTEDDSGDDATQQGTDQYAIDQYVSFIKFYRFR